jgi:hypothetical protein
VIAGSELRGLSLWRPCAAGEHEVSLRASGEAIDRGLVTVVGARLRSATKVPAGWDAWGGAGMFRGGRGLSSPTVGWKAGDGLDGVLVAEALGVAVRAGEAELRLTLVVDEVESSRALTVSVGDEPDGVGAWWGRSVSVEDATEQRAMMARLVARAATGRSYARAGDGPAWSGARATAQWARAADARRAATWWAHDADEARWVVRAEGDGAGLRVTVACATEAALGGWGRGGAVRRSSPWVDFG